MEVLETMHGAAGNDQDLAWAYSRDFSFDSEGEHAFETIGGFFIAIMTVSTGDFAAGGHSNSNMATVLFASCPSARKRTAMPPILIWSLDDMVWTSVHGRLSLPTSGSHPANKVSSHPENSCSERNFPLGSGELQLTRFWGGLFHESPMHGNCFAICSRDLSHKLQIRLVFDINESVV